MIVALCQARYFWSIHIKVTHINRVSAACHAEDQGAPGEQIERQGLWAPENERKKAYTYANKPALVILLI